MFENAIENALLYTRPIHIITRNLQGQITPGAATLFFVNETGEAVTCKHVANLLARSENSNRRYREYRTKVNALRFDEIEGGGKANLMVEYGFSETSSVQLKTNILNCFDRIQNITVHMHPTLDLAIVKFQGFQKILYRNYAVFNKKNQMPRPGKLLCRVGFPFPEFTNFRYDKSTDEMGWTNQGILNSPSFPVEGMLTRFIGESGTMKITGIELSTPGFKGHSGAPLFDENGIVYGMQYATKHLHLGFDIFDQEIDHNGRRVKVSNHPFLHAGMCVHAERIKEFLVEFGVKYYENNI